MGIPLSPDRVACSDATNERRDMKAILPALIGLAVGGGVTWFVAQSQEPPVKFETCSKLEVNPPCDVHARFKSFDDCQMFRQYWTGLCNTKTRPGFPLTEHLSKRFGDLLERGLLLRGFRRCQPQNQRLPLVEIQLHIVSVQAEEHAGSTECSSLIPS